MSILNSVSKLFEKLIQKQLNHFFDDTLSEYLCGYRKGNSTQDTLLDLIEYWQKYRWDQQTKVNGEYSSWEGLLTGAPQGSVLGPLISNIALVNFVFTLKKLVWNDQVLT